MSLILPWLECTTALTQKLKDASGEARLEILNQNWQAANWWDKYVVNITSDTIFQREILMSSRNHPCWYARTIIPEITYHANTGIFKRLSTESLGDIIFSEQQITRTSLQHYCINAKTIEYYWLQPDWRDNEEILYLRLSHFTINNLLPFYLVEILLPGLLRATM